MRKTLELIGPKEFRYRTRRLLPGDTMTCSAREAKIWLRSGKFRETRPMVEIPPAPAGLLAKFDADGDGLPGGSKAPPKTEDLTALRVEYADKLGKRPFPGWGADELRRRIEEAGK